MLKARSKKPISCRDKRIEMKNSKRDKFLKKWDNYIKGCSDGEANTTE